MDDITIAMAAAAKRIEMEDKSREELIKELFSFVHPTHEKYDELRGKVENEIGRLD